MHAFGVTGPQIAELGTAGFHYITAITRAQIDGLIAAGVMQMELFDDALAEVMSADGERYVLRRNPVRAAELAASRRDRLATAAAAVAKANATLASHSRAKVATHIKHCESRAKKLRIDGLVKFGPEERTIVMTVDEAAMAEAARLDGCYAIRTDLPKDKVSKEVVHDRYKDLAQVEWAFRESKQTHLEVRPVFVRNETRTRGHALVVMLAYLIVQHLSRCWQAIDGTVQEGLDSLATLTAIEVRADNLAPYSQIPTPRDDVRRLFEATNVSIPTVLPPTTANVSTKQKLPKHRKQK